MEKKRPQILHANSGVHRADTGRMCAQSQLTTRSEVWGRLVPHGLPVGPHGLDPSKGPARCDHPSFMRRLTPLALTQWPWCQGPPSSVNDMGFSSMSTPGKQQWRGRQAATRATVGLLGRVTPKGSAETDSGGIPTC